MAPVGENKVKRRLQVLGKCKHSFRDLEGMGDEKYFWVSHAQVLDSQMLWTENIIQNSITLPNLAFYTVAEDMIYWQQLKGGVMERSK